MSLSRKNGWAMAYSRPKKVSKFFHLGAVAALLLFTYSLLSANCATGGSCQFASGDLFNKIATSATKGR